MTPSRVAVVTGGRRHLGALCRHGHDHDGSGKSLRSASAQNRCVECERLRQATPENRQKRNARKAKWRALNLEKAREKTRNQVAAWKKANPEAARRHRLKAVLNRKAKRKSARKPTPAEVAECEKDRRIAHVAATRATRESLVAAAAVAAATEIANQQLAKSMDAAEVAAVGEVRLRPRTSRASEAK